MSAMPQAIISDDWVNVYHGDCREVLAALPDANIDAIMTDPPYELAFMGKKWDASGIAYDPVVWGECLRVLKPGGHLLAFGGTRTWHRLAVAVEDAGFEVRDSIAWMYGSGFPKSLNVSKAIDKELRKQPSVVLLPDEARFCEWMRDHSGLTEADAKCLLGSARFITGEVEVVNTATTNNPRYGRRAMVPTASAWEKLLPHLATEPPNWVHKLVKDPPQPGITHPGEWKSGKGEGTIGDNDWQGWGTALKPAFEPIVVARKPLIGTVAENVMAHGTGALNIDGCRIGTDGTRPLILSKSEESTGILGDGLNGSSHGGTTTQGRWPANVILDESQAAELDRQSGDRPAGAFPEKSNIPTGEHYEGGWGAVNNGTRRNMDTGGASRFFYVPKANKKERPRDGDTAHPTVKPLDLMRYLIRLVTPPNGTILDPFAGSGATLEAAFHENINAIGIELTGDYIPLISQRVHRCSERGLF